MPFNSHFVLFLLLTDWILGPKQKEDDLEEGRAEVEEERRLSVTSELTTEKDRLKMENEKDGLLPGSRRPSSPPPLRSSIASSVLRDKRMSAHSVTFACPMTPYVTSL